VSEPFEGWRRLLSRASDLAGILWVGLAHWHIRVFWRIDGFSDRRGRGLGGGPEKRGVGDRQIRLHDAQMPDIGPKEDSIIFLCFAPDLIFRGETGEQAVAALTIEGPTSLASLGKKEAS
jgi:hypothetical protein